jgi:hypothetical protein
VRGGAKNISASLSLLSVSSPRAHLFLQRREHANRTLEAYQSLGTMEQQLQASVEEYNGRKKALLKLFKSMLPFVQSTFVKVCSPPYSAGARMIVTNGSDVGEGCFQAVSRSPRRWLVLVVALAGPLRCRCCTYAWDGCWEQGVRCFPSLLSNPTCCWLHVAPRWAATGRCPVQRRPSVALRPSQQRLSPPPPTTMCLASGPRGLLAPSPRSWCHPLALLGARGRRPQRCVRVCGRSRVCMCVLCACVWLPHPSSLSFARCPPPPPAASLAPGSLTRCLLLCKTHA